jgi:DivIVA domain-containing protein
MGSPEPFPARDESAAKWVEEKRLATTRLRAGYDEGEVDAFLNDIRDTFLGVARQRLTPADIRDKQFTTTRLRPGYDKEQVDSFLNEIEARLATPRSAG